MTNERIFATIHDTIIENTIVADDDFVALIKDDYDAVVEITDEDPRPGIGWGYSEADGSFTAPEELA